MSGKEYLQQLKINDSIIKNLQQEKEYLTDTLYSVSSQSYDGKVQSSRDNDRMGTIFAKIDEKEREIEEKIDSFIDFRMKVVDEINKLSNSKHIKILYNRFVLFKSLYDISDELDRTYSCVTSLLCVALKEFEKVHKDMLKMAK